MDDRLVSVLMPCYKEKAQYFISAINSVINQTYSNLEILILVDNPNDGQLIEIANYYKNKDTRIKVVINSENLGLVKTLNNGYKLATGDIIVRFDSDDICVPNRIEWQIKYIDDYDIVSSNFAFINMEDAIVRHRVFPSKSNEVEYYLKNIADCMYHTTWMVKKKVYYQLEGYREIGPFEDYDFLLRALQRGLKVINLDKELCLYRINYNGISSQNKILQHLGSEYLRENLKNIEDINELSINEFMKSSIALQRAKEYKKFNKITSCIYKSKSIYSYYFKLLVLGPYIALCNSYGRKKIINRVLFMLYK